jgi:uncharacterized membrane protein
MIPSYGYILLAPLALPLPYLILTVILKRNTAIHKAFLTVFAIYIVARTIIALKIGCGEDWPIIDLIFIAAIAGTYYLNKRADKWAYIGMLAFILLADIFFFIAFLGFCGLI